MGLMSAAVLALGAQQAGAALVDVYNGIGTDTTWTTNDQYRLMEPVFVTNGATLTINAGVVVRGVNSGTKPGTLIITRGSKIRAMGTAAAPIVFTCVDDDNIGANPGTGNWANKDNQIVKQWGGVILLGRTYLATNVGEPGTVSPNAGLEVQIEGIQVYGEDSKYGGGNDDDNSGEMHYCSLRYGGFVLGNNNEINGLTLGGVGRGTVIDHIEIFHNGDDDIEFFGGTVNTKYIVAWVSMDDGMDCDEGYRGKQQFMLRVQGAVQPTNERSDKGTEEDGAMSMLAQPSGCPTWYNWTQVGLGKESGQKKNTGMMLREGAGARFYNGLWMDFGGAPALIQGSPTNATAGECADKFVANYVNNAFYTHEAIGLDGVQSKMGEMKYNVFWKFATNVIPEIPVDAGNTIAAGWGANADHPAPSLAGSWQYYGYPAFSNPTLNNFYLSETNFLSPISELTRGGTAVSIPSDKTYTNVMVLNPLPRPGYDGALMTLGRVPPNDGFFTPVSFIGAFGKTKNWAKDWTLASRLGLLTGGVAGDYTGVVPACRNSSGNLQIKLDSDIYAGIKADWYVLLDGGPYGWFRWAAASNTWVPVNIAAPTPSFANADLGTVAWTTVLPVSVLPTGRSYNMFFAIDMVPGNSKLDLDRTFVGSVTVAR